MRSLDEVSGPWRGLSTQEGLRITETLQFRFFGGRIVGEGSDRDGKFQMTGRYSTDGSVRMLRVYYECEIGPEGVGIPYEYRGVWDGGLIAGRWCVAAYPMEGGPFEMWPEREEDLKELEIRFETVPDRQPELVTA